MTPESTTRLVKLLLPAELVRQMDQAIIATAGGYQDRNEYVAEAIRDRLLEEAAIRPHSDPGMTGYVLSQSDLQTRPSSRNGDSAVALGSWRNGSPVTTSATISAEVNFGLHNRDFPSLWALDLLASLSADGRRAPAWNEFTAELRKKSIDVGEQLRLQDRSSASPVPAGISFPKLGPKQSASVERFIAANVGSDRRADGPFFILGLASFIEPTGLHLAPTDRALTTLGEMIDRGFSARLPQPPEAFERWWDFVGHAAPVEHRAWSKLLRLIADRPDRDQLVSQFPEWPGQIASTNTAGFVSRSREWGLVEPKLVDGHYWLTELGSAVAREG